MTRGRGDVRYSTPGDLSTRTDRYTGIDVSVTAPRLGLVIHATRRLISLQLDPPLAPPG